MTQKGMLTIEELQNEVESETIDTVVVAFTDHYGRLLGKRFDGEFFLEEGVGSGTHACDYLLTVDMEMEPVPGFDFASWELGYGDFHLVPDMSTLRRAAWADRTAIVLCDVVDVASHSNVSVAPRSMLRAQLDKAAAMGFTAKTASELEFFIYRDSFKKANKKKYSNLDAGGWYIEDYHLFQGFRVEDFVGAARRHLRDSGVPVENSKGEWGRGQHELNVRYAEALEMADRHVVFKQCLKETAESQGISVTFMAKVDSAEAGSSCHIHLSLWDENGNAFAGDKGSGANSEGSDIFRWFLGGWMAHVRELMVCYAPTVNSYKRYQDGSWAPTRIAWAQDNRTAGFRVVGSGPSLRIECRIPGADVNPYVAYAAALASGLDGIENHIEPPEAFQGDVYAAVDLPRIQFTLREAVNEFKASTFARTALGDDVVDHYAHHLEGEADSYDASVTDWERARYFERI